MADAQGSEGRAVLAVAKREGRSSLSPGQYLHLKDIIKRLVHFNRPKEIADLRIEPVEDFFELKEKGSVLGRINVRVYFGFFPNLGEVVVVKTYKKEEDGKTPRHVVINVQARLRGCHKSRSRRHATIYRARAA